MNPQNGKSSSTDHTHSNSSNDSSKLPSNRQFLSPGKALESFSDFVNENLILFRYGTTATVLFLTAYGLSQTPIFFRFKRVMDIPSSYFAKRKTIYGRIVHVVDNDVIGMYLFLKIRFVVLYLTCAVVVLQKSRESTDKTKECYNASSKFKRI